MEVLQLIIRVDVNRSLYTSEVIFKKKEVIGNTSNTSIVIGNWVLWSQYTACPLRPFQFIVVTLTLRGQYTVARNKKTVLAGIKTCAQTRFQNKSYYSLQLYLFSCIILLHQKAIIKAKHFHMDEANATYTVVLTAPRSSY